MLKSLSIASSFCLLAVPHASVAEVSILCLYENVSLDNQTAKYWLQRISYPHNDHQRALATAKRESGASLVVPSEGVFTLSACQPEDRTTREFRQKVELIEDRD